MKMITKISFLIILSFSISWGFSQTLTGKQIMEKSKDAMSVKGLEAVSTLTILDAKGNKRVRKTSMATKSYGETEKRIIKFLSPADVKGTGLLIFDYENDDDAMWIYMPAIRKTRRIVSSEKSKSFMGSEFTNADMTTSSITDFKYQTLGSKIVNGTNCYEIKATPINEDVSDNEGYSKKIICIGKTDFVMRKVTFYDLDGDLLKILTVAEIKLVDPKNKTYLTTDMTMKNVQTGRKSVIKMDEYQLNNNISDRYFTTDYLEE